MRNASLTDIQALFDQHFGHSPLTVTEIGGLNASVRLDFDPSQLRPGNTLSGPTIMYLADCALYAAVLSAYGMKPLAVTAQLNINFFHKPPAGFSLTARCRLLKKGRRLAIGEVLIFSEGREEMIAQATGTYALPAETRG